MPSSPVKRIAINALSACHEAMRSRQRRRAGLLRPTERSRFLKQVGSQCSVLELGPFDQPQVQGPGVRYFDVLDQDGLKERALREGRNPETCPRIDYVSSHGDLGIVDRKFDTIFSSHVIEHQHDLLSHLRHVADLLGPTGSYYLIIPDKRYCFDHFGAESDLAEVVAADHGKVRTHVESAIRHVHHDLAHNSSLKHWLGLHGRRNGASDPAGAAAASERDIASYRSGIYRDIHAFRFTPASFKSIIEQLFARGLIDMRPAAVHDTGFGQNEFFAVLSRSPA